MDLDAIWGDRSAGFKDEASRWGGDNPMRRGNFGVDKGHPIATNGDLLLSYVKVHEVIKLLFGVMSGIDPGIGKGRFLGVFSSIF